MEKIKASKTRTDLIINLENIIWNSGNQKAIIQWDSFTDTILTLGSWEDQDESIVEISIEYADSIITDYDIYKTSMIEINFSIDI